MKFVGFVKEQDEYFFGNSLIKYYLLDREENKNRIDVLEHLNKGVLCVALMDVAEDADGEGMGTISVYTDGEWVWPDYLNGYLTKFPNFKIEKDFIAHVLKNRDKKIELSDEQISNLEKEFLKIAGFK